MWCCDADGGDEDSECNIYNDDDDDGDDHDDSESHICNDDDDDDDVRHVWKYEESNRSQQPWEHLAKWLTHLNVDKYQNWNIIYSI